MRKKIICKLVALAICACLSAEGLAYASPLNVLAQEEADVEVVKEAEDESTESQIEQSENIEKNIESQSSEGESEEIAAMDTQISINDGNIMVSFVNAVNYNQYYYTGKRITPRIQVFVVEKMTGNEENVPGSEIIEQNGVKFRKVQEISQNEYDIDEYPASTKLGKYKMTVYALDDAETLFKGSKREVEYEIIEKDHNWGEWKTTVK